jgi:hypothetical protein
MNISVMPARKALRFFSFGLVVSVLMMFDPLCLNYLEAVASGACS